MFESTPIPDAKDIPRQGRDAVKTTRGTGPALGKENEPCLLVLENITFQIGETELRQRLEVFGIVKSLYLVRIHVTGQARGMAFVEMINERAARQVIAELDGTTIGGLSIKVWLGSEFVHLKD